MFAPGGRAFVSTNLETWLMHTDKANVLSIFKMVPTLAHVVEYMHQQVLDTNLDFLAIDYPVLACAKESTTRDDYNSNLRLVFE